MTQEENRRVNQVAHDLIKVALNPDRMRAVLARFHHQDPWAIETLEKILPEFTRNL